MMRWTRPKGQRRLASTIAEKMGHAMWLPYGPGEDTRCVRTQAWTAHLSALTHLAPIFGSGMGRLDHACLFGLAHWDALSPFSVCADVFDHAVVIWVA
jgi:hypothetical protein